MRATCAALLMTWLAIGPTLCKAFVPAGIVQSTASRSASRFCCGRRRLPCVTPARLPVPHSVPNMTARTPGALLNNAETPREVLDATEALILPGTETRHETQWVHQKKRRKSAALALSKLADMLVGSGASNRRTQILQDHLFERLIQLTAVAARSEPSEAVDVVEEALFNARCSAQALRALAVLAPVSGLASSTLEELMREVLQGTGGGRTGGAGGLSGAELSGVCWAVQHLGAADSATAAKLVEVRQIEPIQLGGGVRVRAGK